MLENFHYRERVDGPSSVPVCMSSCTTADVPVEIQLTGWAGSLINTKVGVLLCWCLELHISGILTKWVKCWSRLMALRAGVVYWLLWYAFHCNCSYNQLTYLLAAHWQWCAWADKIHRVAVEVHCFFFAMDTYSSFNSDVFASFNND